MSIGTNIVVVNSIFTDIVATKGGGMYCIGYSGVNETASPTMLNAVFAGITAERGGAMAGDVYCDFICNHCWMLYNRVTEKVCESVHLIIPSELKQTLTN